MKLICFFIFVLVALFLVYFNRNEKFINKKKQKIVCTKSDEFLKKLEQYRDEHVCN
jgi:hypothetical protein